ncbi:GNAT family N-acetyltransferase [Microbacterium dextranolyticum]|uniref:Acetyltransferase n=1 Tax=Microbacterium dextranolyticum TaxID=36806 RepID=A0A9W6M5J3_9MICO|nr:GNAT family N-acetyltransferase [Microbacterium dextranolyticum]MBM7463810.1 RimJ/RimL family protein N-acetyltransferase [Microbacterium dextranolyticum]GLJ94891.1 acetyltransferase [Microbacterium dextranolyticum]
MEPVTLRTERLELSAPHEGDVDAVFAACQDADIQRFTTVPSPYERSHAEGFVTKTAQWWAEGTETTWAMRHEGTLVGMIGLHRLGAGAGEIGYWMAPAARGRGLASEAARAVVDWGFHPDGLGLARIEWRAVTSNPASARIAHSLGFRYEGMVRAALVNGAGVRSDGYIAGLLADDDRTPQIWPISGF